MASYLEGVKTDLMKLVDVLQEAIAEDPNDVPEVLKDWRKPLWEFVEDALKTSYRNGQKAGPGAPTGANNRRRFADWRSRPRGEG
jgi:hypothetical protein